MEIEMDMDMKTLKRVEEMVVEMLKDVDLKATIQKMICFMVEKTLGIDLSVPGRNFFFKQSICTFCEQVRREKTMSGGSGDYKEEEVEEEEEMLMAIRSAL